MLLSVISREIGFNTIPAASVGLEDWAANSSARSIATSINLERGTSSSTRFQSRARLPLMPSASVQK